MDNSTRVISLLPIVQELSVEIRDHMTPPNPSETRHSDILESLRGEMRASVLKTLSVGMGKGLVITSDGKVMEALTRFVYTHDHYNICDTDVTTLDPRLEWTLSDSFIGHERIQFVKLPLTLKVSQREYSWIFVDPSVPLPVWDERSSRDLIDRLKPLLTPNGVIVIPLPSPVEVVGMTRRFEFERKESPFPYSIQIGAVEPGSEGVSPKCILMFDSELYIRENLIPSVWFSNYGTNCGMATNVAALREYLALLKGRLGLQLIGKEHDSVLNDRIRYPYFKIVELIAMPEEPIDVLSESILRGLQPPPLYTSVGDLQVPPELYRVPPIQETRHSMGIIPAFRYNEFVFSQLTSDPIVRCCYFPPEGSTKATIYVALPQSVLKVELSSSYPNALVWYSRLEKFTDHFRLYVIDAIVPGPRTSYLRRIRNLMRINREFKLGLEFERLYVISEIEGAISKMQGEEWDGLRFFFLYGEDLSEFYNLSPTKRSCGSIVVRVSRVVHLYTFDSRVKGLKFEDHTPIESKPDVVVRYDLLKKCLVNFSDGVRYVRDTQCPADTDDDIKVVKESPDIYTFLDAIEPMEWSYPCSFSEADYLAFTNEDTHVKMLKKLQDTYPRALKLWKIDQHVLGRLYFLRKLAWETFSRPLDIVSL